MTKKLQIRNSTADFLVFTKASLFPKCIIIYMEPFVL